MHVMLPTLQPLPSASALGAVVLALLGVPSEARPAAAAECRIALGGAPVEGWPLAVRDEHYPSGLRVREAKPLITPSAGLD
jgi:hypothetical protein